MQTIGVLQRLKELYLANNWLPSASLKEFACLKQLTLLDLSHNKLSCDVEKWQSVFKAHQCTKL